MFLFIFQSWLLLLPKRQSQRMPSSPRSPSWRFKSVLENHRGYCLKSFLIFDHLIINLFFWSDLAALSGFSTHGVVIPEAISPHSCLLGATCRCGEDTPNQAGLVWNTLRTVCVWVVANQGTLHKPLICTPTQMEKKILRVEADYLRWQW